MSFYSVIVREAFKSYGSGYDKEIVLKGLNFTAESGSM
jgi:hypothetical protein